MQIDGHYALTYIAARVAGFSATKATIIAHSAQYVDDAADSGVVAFKNGAMYRRISSAHKAFDYRNSDELANHCVWIPFHFLPGNGGKPAGADPEGQFINKLICTPNSYVARDMVGACIKDQDKPCGLHRLGISMHVYADTWSHQGFAGVKHRVNKVDDLTSNDGTIDKNFFNRIANYFVSEAFPLGHGAALSHPDLPSLVWEYNNGLGQHIKRNNPDDFLQATDYMCRAMQCYRTSDFMMHLEDKPGLGEDDSDVIYELLTSIEGGSGEERLDKWAQEIAKGRFSFGAETIPEYIAKGHGSWKHKAIGQDKTADSGREVFTYKRSFLKSDWKLFHDALQAHRFDVLHYILPKYGICAA